MSVDVPSLAVMRDGWDAPPAHHASTTASPATMPRNHRLRLLPLGDGYPVAPGDGASRGREYHPYGLMVSFD